MRSWNNVSFFNRFLYLVQVAFSSHQAVFVSERKHVDCVAVPGRAAFLVKPTYLQKIKKQTVF